MAVSLGELETRFFGYIQSRNPCTVETGQLVESLGITAEQERRLVSRLNRKSLIVRVRRGLYLVPSGLPPGGKWSPGVALSLSTLIADRDGTYQISGANAFSRHGWDEQVPNQIFAYNDKISGTRQIGTAVIKLVKVTESRLGDTEVETTPDGIDLVYSSRVRTLVDAVYDWSRFNTLPKAYEWIREELRADDAVAARIVTSCLRYGNQGTMRRIGMLFQMEGVQPAIQRKLEKALRPTSSHIPWIPSAPKRGETDNRWGVVVNDG